MSAAVVPYTLHQDRVVGRLVTFSAFIIVDCVLLYYSLWTAIQMKGAIQGHLSLYGLVKEGDIWQNGDFSVTEFLGNLAEYAIATL